MLYLILVGIALLIVGGYLGYRYGRSVEAAVVKARLDLAAGFRRKL